MNKDTILYGLLISVGLLGYFALKKNNANSADAKTLSNSASGAFVDDVPVSQEIAGSLLGTGGIKPIKSLTLGTGGIKPVRNLINGNSQIIDPFMSENIQVDLSGQGQFIES